MKISKNNPSLIFWASLFGASLLGGCADPGSITDLEATELEGQESSADENFDPFDLKSDSAKQLIKLPYYFGVPKSTVKTEINRSKYSYPTVWQASDESKDVGLRMIAIRQTGVKAAQKRIARNDMARQLASSGVLQDGDVVLTFRPEFAGSLPYPHIQMGVTHASLTYIKNGIAHNVDSPLNGTDYVGQFNSTHFIGNDNDDKGTDALQIVRSKALSNDPARRERLNRWASLAASNRAYGRVKFQSDYLRPTFTFPELGMNTKQSATELGRILLNQSSKELPMYCSEFVWHMLALSGCTEAQIKTAGPEGASCVAPVFQPMDMVAKTSADIGLGEGPLYLASITTGTDRFALATQVFTQGNNSSRLSSGHRAVSESIAPFMEPLSQYYMARLNGATTEMLGDAVTSLNTGIGDVPNYSPTAFLIQAIRTPDANTFDYIATVLFVNPATYRKAVSIKMGGRSSIPE